MTDGHEGLEARTEDLSIYSIVNYGTHQKILTNGGTLVCRRRRYPQGIRSRCGKA